MLQLRRVRISLVYLLSLLFAGALLYYVIKDKYELALLPVGLAVIFLAIYRMDWLFWGILFCIPFSVPLKEFAPGLDFNLLLPTEPLLAGILVIFIIRLALDGGYDRRVLNHPITQVILFQMAWMLVTTFTSSMPLISVKFFISRLWYLVVFYFLAIQFFKNPRNIRRFIWVYMIPLSLIVMVISFRHVSLGLFDQKASNAAVDPFFNDHTLYGAIMALFIPVAAGYLIRSPLRLWGKIGSFVVLVILLAGLLFSYSRAAWISLVVAILVFVTVILRIRARIIFLGLGILVITLMMAGKNILMKMEKNNQDSSNNLAEHVQSISNISTDASNLERLNRWSCALRMWVKKPLFGWGPGTYMFQYAPFQKESQKTIISTNYGDAGNAHSEYLGPLSEMGLPGGLAMLAIVVVSFITAMRVYKNETIPEMKMLSLVLLLGLVTYFLHGVMNDFLDTDKASAGVWGFMAVLVALDLKRSETKKTTP